MFDVMQTVVFAGLIAIAVAISGCSASVSFDFIEQEDGAKVIHEVTHRKGTKQSESYDLSK